MTMMTIQLHTFTVDLCTSEDWDVMSRLSAAYDHFRNRHNGEQPPHKVTAAPLAPNAPIRPVARTESRVYSIGIRAIDYILRAASEAPPNLPLLELVPRMEALGWKTDSKAPRNIISNLSSPCRRHANMITLKSERVTITEAGRAFVQTLPPLPPVSNDATPEAP